MKLSTIIGIALALATAPAVAQQQRFYGPDGRSLGTAVPLGHGSTRSGRRARPSDRSGSAPYDDDASR